MAQSVSGPTVSPEYATRYFAARSSADRKPCIARRFDAADATLHRCKHIFDDEMQHYRLPQAAAELSLDRRMWAGHCQLGSEEED